MRRPTVTDIKAFLAVLGLSFALDAFTFVGTIWLVDRSLWALAAFAVTTALWAVCVPLMGRRRNILPLVIGAVLAAWVAISV